MSGGRTSVSTSQYVARPAPSASAELSHDVAPWLYVLALLCLIALVAFLYLAQTTAVDSQIEDMERMEDELRRLRWDINVLRLDIATWQTVSRIREEAKRMGFVPAGQVEYVAVELDAPGLALEGDESDVSSSGRGMSLLDLPARLGWLARQFANWVDASTGTAGVLGE